MKTLIVWSLLVAGACAQQAWQDPELQARYERARSDFRAGDYEAARPALRALSRSFPERLDLYYDWARCLVELGSHEEARVAWEELLVSNPDHGLAQIQLAQLLMHSSSAPEEDVARARHCLWIAAQFGYDALGVLESRDEFVSLRSDVGFILELISAPAQRNAGIDTKPRHDPFTELLVPADAPIQVAQPPAPEPPPVDPGVEQRRLLERLEALFAQLDAALLEERPELALEIFDTVEEALAGLQSVANGELRDRIHALLDRYDRLAVAVAELRVRRLDSLLTEQLAELERAVRVPDLVAARAAQSELKRVLLDVDPADAMLARVVQLRDPELARARELVSELAEIFSFVLDLSGIVVGKDGERSVAQAIVNRSIHARDDTVIGPDGIPIVGLQIARIDNRAVRFAFHRLEFSLYLGLDRQIRSIGVLN